MSTVKKSGSSRRPTRTLTDQQADMILAAAESGNPFAQQLEAGIRAWRERNPGKRVKLEQDLSNERRWFVAQF